MTPTQRAAAERLADDLQRFDGAERESLRDEAVALLRELAAEPAQEPVAYIDPRQLAAGYVTLLCITRPEYRSYADVAEGIHYTPVYLHPPQQPMRCPDDGGECGAGGYCRPEPVQRKPLTREQIDTVWSSLGSFTDRESDYRIFARAIERAHGITGEQK